MMKTIVIAIIALLIGGYFLFRKSNGLKIEVSQNDKLKTVNINDLKMNKIIHEELPEDLMNRIVKFHGMLKEVNDTPLDKTIENFKRDQNPENEIAIWEHISNCYIGAINDHKVNSIDEKKEIYGLFLYRSMMPKESVLAQMKLTTLSRSKAIELLDSYEK